MINEKEFIPFTGLISASVLLLSGSGMPTQKPEQLRTTAVARANFMIYWIDTEGGAATLIISPTGESILKVSGSLR
ncbi:MAG: hypothetical protein ICV53_15310 [Flavisolibacter sp.]|nr:hypothetical protein [Flavisolibacter sp.]